MTKNSWRLKSTEGFLSYRSEDEAVIYNCMDGCIHVMDALTAEILDLLHEGTCSQAFLEEKLALSDRDFTIEAIHELVMERLEILKNLDLAYLMNSDDQ